MKFEGCPQSQFPTPPTAIKQCIARSYSVYERVMTSHDTCTSGTFRVLTVASLQRLKMEALIPAPSDYEVRSMIKFFAGRNSSSAVTDLWPHMARR